MQQEKFNEKASQLLDNAAVEIQLLAALGIEIDKETERQGIRAGIGSLMGKLGKLAEEHHASQN